jgi:hypothetical protein
VRLKLLLNAPVLQELMLRQCHMSDLHVRPSARGAWQPSRGLRSRYGANPEKKIATDFGDVAHTAIVGEAICEVKASRGSGKKSRSSIPSGLAAL